MLGQRPEIGSGPLVLGRKQSRRFRDQRSGCARRPQFCRCDFRYGWDTDRFHARCERCYLRWAEEYNVPTENLHDHHGLPSGEVAARLVPPEQVKAAAARIEELECTDLEGVTALPGALRALTTLPADQIAICTSCTDPLFEVRLPASGLPCPETVVTVNQVERGKPEPDPYLLACEKLGVAPGDALVFEDAKGGVTAAKAAGCACIAVRNTSPDEWLTEADAIIDDLDVLKWWVQGGRIRLSTR